MTVDELAFETVLQVGFAFVLIVWAYIRIGLLAKKEDRRLKEANLGATAASDFWKAASKVFLPLGLAGIVLGALLVKAFSLAF